jgi:hypothetical protein
VVVQLIHADEDFSFGVVGPVVLSVWRTRVTEGVFRRAMPVFERSVARIAGPSAYVSVVAPASSPPPAAVLAELRHSAAAPTMVRMVAVLEGDPPWLARGVDVLTSVVPSGGSGRMFKVCVDLREGLHWLTRQREPSVAPTLLPQLERAIDALRVAPPSAAAS